MLRELFLIHCGPSLLPGISLRDWLRLLKENHFSLAPACLLRAVTISACATVNSVVRRYEDLRYGRQMREVHVPPPLFVLGHWRSGTSHLHNLLSVDNQFGCANFCQAYYPQTFLSTESLLGVLPKLLLPRRRPYDDVRLGSTVPCEDEFAMCARGFRTPYLSKVFPRRAAHYDRYLTFRDAPASDIAEWKAALLLFLKKLTLRYRKPLILKSPTHTSRIKLLLELFPDAKFVHIHRDPYAVYKSTTHMYAYGLPFGRLQRTDSVDWSERTLRQYREMYDAFFEQRDLIPAGHFHEVRYEHLDRDPMGEMRKLYAALHLPGYDAVEPQLRRYVDSLDGYRKNVFPDLPRECIEQVTQAWRRSFLEWDYPTRC